MIVRAKRSSHYTVINNTVINDDNLDWKELGLLVYLLSKPNYWEVSVSHLAKIRKTKTNGIYNTLKTLKHLGYIRMIKKSSGQVDWVVYEKPDEEKPDEEKPDEEKPDEEKPDEEKPDEDLTTQVITERAVSTERENKGITKKIDFDSFYTKYPVKKNKATAEKKWKTMSAKKQQQAINGISSYLLSVGDINYAAHPSTYLNQERWNDEVTQTDSYQGHTEREMI